MLGWAIVGLGRIAETQIAPAIAAAGNGTLVSVIGRDEERTAAFAARHGARSATTDYAAALADPRVDAVYIATPNALHAEQVSAAAQAGKHILCDKPLAGDGADAQRLVDECAAAGVALGLVFQTRNHEGMGHLRDVIAAGEIGEVVLAQVEMSSGRAPLAGWRTDPAQAGAGTVNNIGVHGYDLLRYLLGDEVTEVTAMLRTEPGESLERTALALLRLRSGALAYVNANQSVPDYRADLTVYGSAGRIVGTNITRPDRTGTIEVTTGDRREELTVSSARAYAKTVTDFAAAVLDGRRPSPDGADGVACARIAAAVLRSAVDGRTTRV